MPNPVSLGTPCLVPVQVESEAAGSCRGFITRLARTSLAISTDPALTVGNDVTLRFRKLTDNSEVSVRGIVREHLSSGSLWRGRPAAMIDLSEELDEDLYEASPIRSERRAPRSAEAATRPGPDRRDPATPAVLGAITDPPTSPAMKKLHANWLEAAADMDEEATAPPQNLAEDDSLSPPRGGDDDDIDSRHTEAALQSISSDDMAAPAPQDEGERQDEEFFGMFGQVSDGQNYNLPPPPNSDVFPGLPGAAGHYDLNEDATVPPISAEDSSLDGYDGEGMEDLLGTGAHEPAISNPPPVHNTASIDGRAPWESSLELDAPSLIPRNVRIAAQLPVTFWARGRQREARAQNFSSEGLFLAFADTPPVRGAIVRVEFPLEGDGETVPVRFNAEVRWHTADRPGSNLPEGFGVQILTFETPKDRIRYEELVVLILSLHQEQNRKESEFQWGSSRVPGS